MLQVEVAGTVIQLEDHEAAVIVYGPAEWQGKTVTLHRVGLVDYNHLWIQATITGRVVNGRDVYAAVFPRINLVTEEARNERKISSGKCSFLIFSHAFEGGKWEPEMEVFLGNVNEIDWSNLA